MSTLTWGVWVLEVLVLVALSVGFTYPVVAYSQNVLYRDGILLFVVALACLMVGSVCELLVDLGVAGALLEVLAYAWYAAGGLVSVLATWRFAREFVDLRPGEGVDVETDEFAGGFEDER